MIMGNTINDKEKEKYQLGNWEIASKIVDATTAEWTVGNVAINDLEMQKFDASGNVRVLVTT